MPTRRRTLKLAIALPAALAAPAAADETPPAPSPLAACVAAGEPSLGTAERASLQKAMASLEQALSVVRAFPLGNEVEPAFAFRPQRSRR